MKKIKSSLMKKLAKNDETKIIVDSINEGNFDNFCFFNPNYFPSDEVKKSVWYKQQREVVDSIFIQMIPENNHLDEYCYKLSELFNAPQSWIERYARGVKGIVVYSNFGQNYVGFDGKETLDGFFSKEAYERKSEYAYRVSVESIIVIANNIAKTNNIQEDDINDLIEELEPIAELSHTRHTIHSTDRFDFVYGNNVRRLLNDVENEYYEGELVDVVNGINKKYKLVDSDVEYLKIPIMDLNIDSDNDIIEYYGEEVSEDEFENKDLAVNLIYEDWNNKINNWSNSVRVWFGKLNKKFGSKFPSSLSGINCKNDLYHLNGLGSVVEIINLKDNKFAVVSPYNSDFVKKAHDLKGKWDKVNRKNGDAIKCWIFENSEKEEVKKVLLQIYGTTGEEKSEKNITLLVKDFSDYVLRGSVVLFGVVVARAFGRDSGVKLGDRIVWLSGEKYSGGSVKNWKTIVENATFKIKNVPYGLLENNENLKKAIQDGWVEIVDEKDNKDEEKNIETIDSILESGKTTLNEKQRKLLLSYSGNGGSKTSDERGILDEYYTPDYICEFMYQLAVKYGYKKGKILEPSCAIGNIIRPFYERNDYNHIDAFEINDKSRKICKLLYPNVKVYENYFETAFLEQPRFSTKIKKGTWLSNAPYDLVIGNPPYGKHTNKFSTYFNGNDRFEQIEMFFMYKGLDLLRSGGLLIYITSTNFLSTGNKYLSAKERIGSIADFIDAYRLPKVFSSTDICTDIIVLRKK